MTGADMDIRRMTRHELDTLIDWAADEGWNPGLDDAEAFWAADPHGFIAAEFDGELVGGGAIIAYEKRYGFMGLFLVRPDYRGHGLGNRLWHERKRRLLERVMRPCRIGYKIGPLFAANTTGAESLLLALGSRVAGQPVFVDVPEKNREALALVARHGMKQSFGCARMILGPVPHLPDGEIFGVTTFELG